SLCHAPAPSVFYTLSLPDALPISLFFDLEVFSLTARAEAFHDASPFFSIGGGLDLLLSEQTISVQLPVDEPGQIPPPDFRDSLADRKSTRLNSSHVKISYAVFCLK